MFPIRIPPLRERIEDIPSLANHFAEKAAIRFGLALVLPTPDDLRRLTEYPWPGNIRELGSVIDRAAILGNGKQLAIAAALGIPASVHVPGAYTPCMSAEPAIPQPSSAQPFDDAVRQHIEASLKSTQGRVDGPFGAAKLLGLNPNTLRSKMRKLRINPKKYKIE